MQSPLFFGFVLILILAGCINNDYPKKLVMKITDSLPGVTSDKTPQDEADKIINSLASYRGVFEVSPIVTFTQNQSVTHLDLLEATRGILTEESQVCVVPGHFKNDDRFMYDSEKSIVYNGNTPQEVFITGICDTGSLIAESPPDYFDQYTNGAINFTQTGICGCINVEFNKTCCIISLEKVIR